MKRNEKKYHNNKIDNICAILLYVILPCIVCGIVLLISITSHASGENEETPEYPMIIDFAKNPADTTLEEIQNAYSIMWGDLPESYIIYCAVHDQIYINGSHGWDYYDYYQYTISVNPVFDYPTELSVTSPYYYITNGVEYYFDYIPDIDHWGSYNSATNIRHQYAYSYMAQGLGWILYGTEDEYTSIQDVVVWAHRHSGPIINTGVATLPLPFIYPEYLTGDTPPTNVPPTYTVNNYSWSTYTPPTVDNSSVQNLLESLTDIVKYNANYLKDNLHNEFANLIDNIKGLIDYIGQTIQYYGNLIIDTLQNLITTFYNNMVSIGEDITNKLTYIVSPLDTTAITSAFQDTGIYNDYDAIFDMVQDAFGFYNDISEPTSFMIPIDLRSVTILHQRQIIYIDLGWLNSCKTIIRAFMWCVLTFGLLYTIIDSIPDYLQGNDE